MIYLQVQAHWVLNRYRVEQNFCFFVDNKSESLNFLTKNIENLNLQDKSKLIKFDFKKLILDQKSIDIIFVDPPYNMGLLNDAIEISLRFVKSDGCILIKRDKLESHDYKNIIKQRRFNDTIIEILMV